jgi:hypothetical protein
VLLRVTRTNVGSPKGREPYGDAGPVVVVGVCEHERGKRGSNGRWRSRGLRCCTRDGGLLALQSRLAEEGSKPPRGALAEDRGLERRRKRRGRGSRQVWTGKMSDEREFSVVDVSKPIQLTSKPGLAPCSGKNLGDIRLLPRWCPAYRQHEPGPGSRMEHVKARTILLNRIQGCGGCGEARGRTSSGRIREELSTVAGALADSPVVAVIRLRIAVGWGAKGWGCPGGCV